MLQHTMQGDELTTLAVGAEEYLREKGLEVKAIPNQSLSAFELRPDGDDRMLCRVQSIGRETFEIARAKGETITGLGGQDTMFALLERVVREQNQEAA